MTRKLSFIIVVVAYIAAFGLGLAARSNGDDPPSSQQIAFAEQVSNLMLNELVAALFTEFDETTPENVPHGKQAISLIFNDLNRDMRLIGAFAPLLGGRNNRPSDRFERTALEQALGGEAVTDVQQINDRWYYRRSIPLSNTMHPNCVQCHTNFTADEIGPVSGGQWVGALVLGVPINTGDDR